jgi:hypothetical protein
MSYSARSRAGVDAEEHGEGQPATGRDDADVKATDLGSHDGPMSDPTGTTARDGHQSRPCSMPRQAWDGVVLTDEI